MEAYTKEQFELFNRVAGWTDEFKQGKLESYNSIYTEMLPHVLAMLKNMNVPEADVDDVAIVALTTVYKNLASVQDSQAAYKWILNVSRNKAVDYFRQNGTRISTEQTIYTKEDDTIDEEALYKNSHQDVRGGISIHVPEDIFVNKEKQAMLAEIIKSLKDDQKQIVMMHCFEDMTFKSIAEIMGMSENSVKTKFYRSLKKLETSILETEKREGIRLHSAGVIPFVIFVFAVLGSKEKVSAAEASKIATAVSENIYSGTTAASNMTATSNMATAEKAISSVKTATKLSMGAKIAIGVAAAVVVGGAVAAGVTLSAGDKQETPEIVELQDNTEVLQPETETETEVVVAENYDDILLTYYDELTQSKGVATESIVCSAKSDDMGGYNIQPLSGAAGLLNGWLVDIDSDGINEMIVAGFNQGDRNAIQTYIQLYKYNPQTEMVEELTGDTIVFKEFGFCEDRANLAYRIIGDEIYFYQTRAFYSTFWEGGYNYGYASIYKYSKNGGAQLVVDPYQTDVIETFEDENRLMEYVKDDMPTIYEGWVAQGSLNDVSMSGNLDSAVLMSPLSTTDPEYVDLASCSVNIDFSAQKVTSSWTVFE